MEIHAKPWSQFQEELLKLYEPPMRSKRTAAKMRGILRNVGELGVITTADVTPVKIAEYITTKCQGMQPATVRGHLLYIQAACNAAEAMGLLPINPFRVRRMRSWVRVPRREVKRHFSRDEIARVLAVMQRDVNERAGWALWKARRLFALTSLVAHTGLRRNEALNLHVADVDLANRWLAIVPRDGNRLKTEASSALVPVPIAMAPTLGEWLTHRLDAPPEGPLTEEQRACPFVFPNLTRTNAWIEGDHGHRPLERLQAVAKRAGVSGITFQSLCHSLATHAEFWGLGETAVQRLLRHTTTSTQAHYRHMDLENMRSLADRIGFP